MRVLNVKLALWLSIAMLLNRSAPCQAQPGPGENGAVLRNPFDPPAPRGNGPAGSGTSTSAGSAFANSAAYRDILASLTPDSRYAMNRDIQPTPDLGPWMICVHSYVVKEAPEFARQMAAELRSTYRLPAYVFTFGLEERRKEFERVQGMLEKQRKFFKEQNLEIMYAPRTRDGGAPVIVSDELPPGYALQLLKDVQHIQVQCAVLLGGYPNEEAAHRALTTIRDLKQPDPNKVKLDVKFYGAEETANQGKLKLKNGAAEYVNPFKRAFVCRNPSIKSERGNDASDSMDINALRKWNSDEAYSLLNCRKPITLAIKQFQTYTTIQSKDQASRIFDSLGWKTRAGDGVDQAAHDAHELADLLRKNKKLDTYVLHTKYSSIVTVGGYDSLEDPSLTATQSSLGNMLQQWPSMMFFPRPMPMKVPR